MMLRALNARLARVLRGQGGAAGAAEEGSSDEERTPSAPGGGPDAEVGTLPLVGTGLKSIRELCAEMHTLGYEYATLTDKTELLGFKPALQKDLKPRDALFFSKFVETWGDNDEKDGCWAPEWYVWVEQNPPFDEAYSIKNIMFAKFDPAAVIDLARDGEVVNTHCTERHQYLWFFDWPALRTAGFKGVMYNHEEGWQRKFSTWDVSTVAIWDATALRDVKLFKHPQFMYSATGQDVAV